MMKNKLEIIVIAIVNILLLIISAFLVKNQLEQMNSLLALIAFNLFVMAIKK